MKQKREAWKALIWIGLSELFALSLWFSATVVAPELMERWSVTPNLEMWLSSSVPIGFVLGAFISSYVGLSDRHNPRKVFAISALIGALMNGLLIIVDHTLIGIILRIVTGVALAGVYPTAVQMISQWFPKQRGLAIGIVIAALTMGSAFPHVVSIFFASINWQLVILTSSMLAILSSAMVTWLLNDPPKTWNKTPFTFKLIKKVRKNKPVMLANYGYFGHMWELYAMWTWLPVFLTASFQIHSPQTASWVVGLLSFISIGIAGGIGCVVGGIVADKIGRSRLTIISMVVSATCALLIGITYGQSIWLTSVIAVIWGIFVISDSAQFSAAVSDFSTEEYVGTALTFQMCVGFLITIVSINAIPVIQQLVGWQWVFSTLAIGPILGIIAMIKLKGHEERRGTL